MSFHVPADAYDRFMGRYSTRLAPLFADFARVSGHVVDVGCGPGALTAELLRRSDVVSAADPSEPFVAALRERFPAVDARVAGAEALPFEARTFDGAVAQLVVHFMTDPVGGIAEMARVTRAGGVVAACTWDLAGDSPLTAFWRAARAVDPEIEGESDRPGAREGALEELFAAAGVSGIEGGALELTVEHATFDEWWQPYTLGVGPAGGYLARLDAPRLEAIRRRAHEDLGDGPIAIHARAWAARGTVI